MRRTTGAIALRVAAVLFVVGALISACDVGPRERSIRIVLITLDTLRNDRFTPSPGHTSKMPRTRSHAERGVIFNRYYTVSPVTQPTHATLLTGLQPWDHGITRNGIVLPEHFPSVVSVLQQNGFETRAVVASFPLTKRFGFARGFDAWTEEFTRNLSDNKSLWEDHWTIESGEFFAIGDSISDRAIAELDAATADRQFFWFHYFDPHAPYGDSSGEEPSRKRDIMVAIPSGRAAVDRELERATALYDEDVAFLDGALDRVLRKLHEDEVRYETHIVVVSDHGESLGEEGSVGHGTRLNDVELHVPAFVISPRAKAGASNELTSSIDIAPTLLSFAGIAMEGATLEGRDLLQPARGDSRSKPWAYAMRRTFREDGKFEQLIDGTNEALDGLLFGAIDSAGAIHRGNQAGLESSATHVEPATRAQIVDRFRQFQEDFERVTPTRALDPDVRSALEALGYVE